MTEGITDVEDDQLDDDPTAEQAEPLDLSKSDRKLVTQPYDFPVHSLSSDIESGRIALSIEYQRQYVWDAGKASRLIESLLLNVPIPVCYFAEVEDGGYEVIDGLQRLTAIKRFLENESRLSNLSVLSELNGKNFKELDARDQRRLQNRTIRCIVITEESDPDIKFDVFERLNTGAAVLNAQELRNSVYRGAFNDSLKELAKDNDIRSALGVSRNTRMLVEEIALRFFALVDGLPDYAPPLRQFLNTYMRTRRNKALTPDEVQKFRGILHLANEAFGGTPFRSPSSKNPVNKALFDAIMLPLAFVKDPDQLREVEMSSYLSALLVDDAFSSSIGRATADKQRMYGRIRSVAAMLEAVDVELTLPIAIVADSESGDEVGHAGTD
ncbi:DUF262 domain-containing protein [Knoellia subterranea]|uniref:GmrSD restriction endonucleases N-terminal domain-containing protein n=1 Tax=Knoellia subterranea KCTC 19937 TaxID=1385521 RepID=A0A0A0JMB1_9MICO|nr:DUF262 domain-containing protein [Knoellia subterranea]KGN37197.1 hypothetical protein N803_15205 [Knoellia subterranea KCTC 19937]